APVHWHFRHVGQPSLEQLQKNPLCPAIIIGVDCADLTFPVVRQTDTFHLAFERGDVLRRRDGRMDARLHGVLLGGQAERVPPHGMQHIEAPHALIAGDDVRRDVAFQMAHMQARPGRLGKHVEAIELGLGGIVRDAKRPVFLPIGLPFRLDGVMVVTLAHSSDSGGSPVLKREKKTKDSNIAHPAPQDLRALTMASFVILTGTNGMVWRAHLPTPDGVGDGRRGVSETALAGARASQRHGTGNWVRYGPQSPSLPSGPVYPPRHRPAPMLARKIAERSAAIPFPLQIHRTSAETLP